MKSEIHDPSFCKQTRQFQLKKVKMKSKIILSVVFLFLSTIIFAQTTVSGKILDKKNKPIANANIYIDGSYDGTTSNENGEFTFVTNLTGSKTLVISCLTYDSKEIIINIEKFQNQTLILKESINTLDTVVIAAGNLDSGDKARVSVLKPLDIVTTAGSAGNIIAALQTLPGTNNVGEDGRLFVRGGEADETQTFVDGIRVAQPYNATTNNLPTRGRFSPFLFSGMSFSTGGYSAEFGEALSSVLLLNTADEATQNQTNWGFMTVGLSVGNTKKFTKSSLSVNANYINLAPYIATIKQNVDWKKPYQSASGEAVYRYNFANGIFKLYATFDVSDFELNQESINYIDKIMINLNNNNFYMNSSYKGNFGTKWQIQSGLSYGFSQNKINLSNPGNIINDEKATHLKLKFKKTISDRLKLNLGTDYFITQFNEDFVSTSGSNFNSGYTNSIGAFFTEAEVFFSKELAAKIGLRATNNNLLNENTLSPRFSMAYKVARNSQFALAYGNFNQTPKQDLVKFSNNHQFESEKAQHYIFNFQYNKDGQTFRAETYFKDYSNLVKYDTQTAQYNSVFNQNGNGFAKGLDLYWRDNKNIKNLEYWISYSYIDSKRDYKNFSTTATPSFVANHTASIVTKYWINDWKSQIGLTHSFASGRPYNDPNETVFMNGKTKEYNSLSFSWVYLLTTQKILYFSVSNVFGTQNVFGYEYTNTKTNGIYNRREVTPTADRFFFVGFFWTISSDKKTNQLKDL